ncbi:unnamed protein product [Ectocarpus sp. 12 AP-2014]
MEEVRSDQRFEQLVEIIECVAKDLSVSDTSKARNGAERRPYSSLSLSVVWGLSILGHVPRNSLLESLASFLTDRLRQEAAAAAASSAAEDIGGNPGEGEGGANGEKVTVTGGTEDGISSPSSSDSPQERGLGSGSGTPAEGRDDGQFSGVEGGNAGGGGGGGGGADAVDKATTGAASAKKEVAAACTSGTDLATAALSFAYAHARLDISTGELLEVIAACATPQLAAMPLRDLANLSWAFAVQRRLHPEMMAGVGREIVSSRASGRMAAKDASILAWAYGMLDLRPARVIEALTREGLATVKEATPHDLANLAWGLAKAGAGGGGKEEEEVEDPVASAASEDSGSGGGAGKEAKAGEEAEASALGESVGASGGGGDADGGGGGAWGLGWVKSRLERGSGPEGDGEGKEQEDCGEGLSEEGSDRGEASSDSADDNATSVENLADLVPGGKEEEASMEQRLGEAVLARATSSTSSLGSCRGCAGRWGRGTGVGRSSSRGPTCSRRGRCQRPGNTPRSTQPKS